MKASELKAIMAAIIYAGMLVSEGGGTMDESVRAASLIFLKVERRKAPASVSAISVTAAQQ